MVKHDFLRGKAERGHALPFTLTVHLRLVESEGWGEAEIGISGSDLPRDQSGKLPELCLRDSMSKGWALGGRGFKQALLQDQAVAVTARAWESTGVREVREAQWQAVLDRLRRSVPAEEIRDQRKSAPWKVTLALQMKATTDASNGWLAAQLDMGSGFYLSKHVGLARRKVKGKA